MSESSDFGIHFQRCVTVMALQDKLQNEKEGREHFTLLLHFTTDISTYYKIAAYIVFISLSCRALGMFSLGTLQRGCCQNSLSFFTLIALLPSIVLNTNAEEIKEQQDIYLYTSTICHTIKRWQLIH